VADDPAALTQEQKDRIVAWLKARGAPRACAACGHNNWTMANHLVSPPLHRVSGGGGFMFGGPAYPQAMVICANCGHTVYFNTVVMGILTDDSPKQPPSGGDPPKTPTSNG
jgi:hypothetical protein